MKLTVFPLAAALTVTLLTICTNAKEDGVRSNNTRRLPAGGNGKGNGKAVGHTVDQSADIAGTAHLAKTDKKHVGIQGLGVSPAGQSDEVDLVVTNTFSADCRLVHSSTGSSEPCHTGRVVLVSSPDELTFTVLSTDESTGETKGFSMSGGKKFFKIKQKKNNNAEVEDATDEEFEAPDWACHNEEAAQASKDDEERRRLLGHDDHHHHHHDGGDHDHNHDHHLTDLGEALEREGLKLRGTRRLATHQQPVHRNLETYYTDNVGYKYTYEVGIYIEVDETLVNKCAQKGTTVNQYIEDLFAGMNIMYEKEVDTHLAVVGIEVVPRYDSASGTSAALNIQRNQLIGQNWPDPNADLVHAILGRSLGGGVAYVGAICDNNYGLGVSAGIAVEYDIDDPKKMVWDITVVAHELGHNFNSGHTHDGYNAPVDQCTSTCSGVVAGSATIMSYCHLCAGSESNMAATFGGYRTGASNWIRSPELTNGLSVDPERVPEKMHTFVKSLASPSVQGSCVEPISQDVPTQICTSDAQCDDNNPCTTDTCNVGVGCQHTAIAGCASCGNGVCEVGEATSNCPSDCPCVDNPEGWYDSDGPYYDCQWYSAGSNCADYGDSYENGGTTANQACCACGGGSPTSGGPDAPTISPTDTPTKAPTDAPTKAPTTDAPTKAPTTDAPTKAPTTDAPTKAPTTYAPTKAPTTDAPTKAPTTDAPTKAPTTDAPTKAPTTDAPTKAPTTDAPTKAPTTDAPTKAPTTDAPTKAPTTDAPTKAPTTDVPTKATTTDAPTKAPTTDAPTKAPTDAPTKSPTDAPTNEVVDPGCTDVTVEIRTDWWGDETSWTIADSSSTIVMTGTGYGATGTFTTTECLPSDTYYVFTIYDSYGDGILDGGGYTITAGPTLLADGGGDFGYSEFKEFTLGDGAPNPCQCTDNPAGWYDSDGPLFDCDWYSDGSNCANYGDSYANFGTTANVACCACGGGENICS